MLTLSPVFRNTFNAIDEMGLTFLHVFPYSNRPGTPAAKMPVIDGATIKARAQRLRHKGNEALNAYLRAQRGDRVQVLIEQGRQGHSRHFAPVELTCDAPVGAIIDARVKDIDETKGRLIAELAA